MRLTGKIGIVTAAASGMGRAGALRFAREGAQVAVVDVDAPASRAWSARSPARAGPRTGSSPISRRTRTRGASCGTPSSRFKGLDFVWNHVGHPGPAASRAST